MLKGRSCHAAALQGLRVQPIGSIRGRVACFSPVFLLWCLPLLAASLPPSLLRRPFSCRRFNRKLKKGRRSDANEHFLKDAASAEFAEIPQRRCSFHYFPFHTAGAASGVGGGGGPAHLSSHGCCQKPHHSQYRAQLITDPISGHQA